MGYVTHSTTETVNELSQTTSIHFESFEDFLKWDKMKSCETAELNVSNEGPIEITALNINVEGGISQDVEITKDGWYVHDGSDEPKVKFNDSTLLDYILNDETFDDWLNIPSDKEYINWDQVKYYRKTEEK